LAGQPFGEPTERLSFAAIRIGCRGVSWFGAALSAAIVAGAPTWHRCGRHADVG